ncbi:hypothetical protein, partial [Marinospirillum sp.]|uniref:hypothetical protein n=1 Tax=Marinospirillum sp. TaxID=2183934 RepID=UPI0025C6FA52
EGRGRGFESRRARHCFSMIFSEPSHPAILSNPDKSRLTDYLQKYLPDEKLLHRPCFRSAENQANFI